MEYNKLLNNKYKNNIYSHFKFQKNIQKFFLQRLFSVIFSKSDIGLLSFFGICK